MILQSHVGIGIFYQFIGQYQLIGVVFQSAIGNWVLQLIAIQINCVATLGVSLPWRIRHSIS